MIKELIWDTNFFGFKIGRIDIVQKLDDLDSISNTDFKLIYVFSHFEIKGLIPVDKKVNFEKKIERKASTVDDIVEFDKQQHNYLDLLELAYLSGVHSRFKLDKGFSVNDFKKMYKIWIDESIKKNIALSVLVKLIDKKIAGFVTIEEKNNNTSRIGLIAVANNFQGKGIASQLINAAENESFLQGYKNFEVATQLDNIPAMKLYKKNGFSIESITNIYHIWNK